MNQTGILHRASTQLKKRAARKPMGRSKPKTTAIRRSARGEECTLRIPGICNWNTETTVWAHSNRGQDGKGMGLKARDEEGCYACSCCHSWLDYGYAQQNISREAKDRIFDMARAKSQNILREKGLF